MNNKNTYCNYSFDDLHYAAYGKRLKEELKEELQRMEQSKINELVLKWAKKAKWRTQEKIGTDKKTYLSFQPKL